MPPQTYSRHLLCSGITNENGLVYLSDRVPYRYRELDDNQFHTVVEGDSIFSLADRYFRPLPRPAGFFWVICDFQPTPIIDPTVKLALGQVLVIPSKRTLEEEILNPRRTSEFEG